MEARGAGGGIHIVAGDLEALAASLDGVRDRIASLDVSAPLEPVGTAMPGSQSSGRTGAAVSRLEGQGRVLGGKHVNVDKMLEDTTSLGASAEEAVTGMCDEAVKDARASGAEGPVTYPFTTEWAGYYIHSWEDQNWFYATAGGWYATEDTVTVYPPTQDNPEWTYSYDYRVHVADRYNWDGSKSTQILGRTITDEQLQELHQAGIAQEYDMWGESSVVSGSGS